MMNEQHRADLIEEYARRIVEGLDMDAIVELATEMLISNLETYTDEQLVEEVSEYYPDLMETE